MRTLGLAFACVLATACSKKQDAAPAPAPAADTNGGDHIKQRAEHEHEMAGLPPELSSFHDLLAPHWHAAQGQQRMTDTCAAIGDFKTKADAAKNQPLVDAVAGLATACGGTDLAAFDAAFGKVHDSFHAAMEAGHGK